MYKGVPRILRLAHSATRMRAGASLLRSPLRLFSTSSIPRADAPDTLSQIIKELDSGKKRSTGAAAAKSGGGGGGGDQDVTKPAHSRNLRSDTGNVYFRDSDAEKYKLGSNKYHLHCLTSHSNTLLTLTNHRHEPVMWTSAGLCGFKKAARGGYEAGFRSTTMMLEKMRERERADEELEYKLRTEPHKVQKMSVAKKNKPSFKPASIEIIIRDFGLGREAVMKALMGVEGDHYRNKINKIVDVTPMKFGGVRSRAKRRL